MLFLGVFACDGIVSRKMSIVTMNRSCLFPAGLLCLGLFVSGCPGKNPKEQKASGAPAPATIVPATVPAAAPGSSDDQIIESLGWSIGKRLSLPELEFSKEQEEKQEISFYFFKHKAFVLEWSLAPLRKNK